MNYWSLVLCFVPYFTLLADLKNLAIEGLSQFYSYRGTIRNMESGWGMPWWDKTQDPSTYMLGICGIL